MFLMDEWHDVRFGPLKNMWGERVLPPSPPWWCYTCELSRTPPGEMLSTILSVVSGVALDQHIAFNRVCGEALERYCAMIFHDESWIDIPLKESPFLDLIPRCCASESAPTSLTRQWLVDNSTLAIPHVRARSFADEQPIWVPNSLVTLAKPCHHDVLLSEITSSGLAFGRTLVDALFGGLAELIERDSAMISWWCQRPAKRLVQLDAQPRIRRHVEHLSRLQVVPYLFDISQDIPIPTVACLLRSESYPYWTAGAACNCDPIQACLKAIDEAVSVRLMLDREPSPINSLSGEPTNALERATLFARERGSQPFEYLFNSPLTSVDLWSKSPWLRTLAELVHFLAEDLGYVPVWKDLTTDDVASTGFVIRAIVPELVPMSQEVKWLDTPRLRSFQFQDWNPFPHPFA